MHTTPDTIADSFAARPRPKSGVLSRSRLRAWFFDAGGTEETWGAFLSELVQRDLWRPWHGDDIALIEREASSSGGYRDQLRAPAREGELSYATEPNEWLLPPMVVLALALFMTGVGAAFSHLPWFVPTGIALTLVLLAVLRRPHTRRIKLSGDSVQVLHDELGCSILLRDIVWVDVVSVAEDRLSQTDVHLARLIAKTRDGTEHVLSEPVRPESLLSLCRAIESAMIDAAKLELANAPKVRVAPAAAPSWPLPVEEDVEEESEGTAKR